MSFIQSGGRNKDVEFDKFKHEGEYEYTSKVGGINFKFELASKNGQIRIYITKGANYGSRPTDGHATHRNYDSDKGQHWVCTNPNDPPKNIRDATTWLVMWAEGTDNYIRTGTFKQERVV